MDTSQLVELFYERGHLGVSPNFEITRDVPLSLCPGTRAGANVPGQTPLSRDVPGQIKLKIFKKITKFSVFGHHFPVLEQRFLF